MNTKSSHTKTCHASHTIRMRYPTRIHASISQNSTIQGKSLKEWAPTIEALRHGDQTVLFRKGGIKDPVFTPEASEFLLFPTAFHTEGQLLKPDARIKYANALTVDPKSSPRLEFTTFAKLTGAWTTLDARNALQLLDDFHIHAPEFIEARLRWKPSQPVTIMEVRAYQLQQPVILDAKEEMWGCFSWVDLGLDSSITSSDLLLKGAIPALTDEEFAKKQQHCREKLQQLTDLTELVLL